MIFILIPVPKKSRLWTDWNGIYLLGDLNDPILYTKKGCNFIFLDHNIGQFLSQHCFLVQYFVSFNRFLLSSEESIQSLLRMSHLYCYQLKVKTSIGNAPISKNEMELLLPIMWKNMFWILHDDTNFDGKPPTNWYIGKLVYLSPVERYEMHVSRTCGSPIYIFLCTVLLTLWRLGQISYHFDDSRTLQYIYARWSTFSDRFHNVSFTMQSHDHTGL